MRSLKEKDHVRTYLRAKKLHEDAVAKLYDEEFNGIALQYVDEQVSKELSLRVVCPLLNAHLKGTSIASPPPCEELAKV